MKNQWITSVAGAALGTALVLASASASAATGTYYFMTDASHAFNKVEAYMTSYGHFETPGFANFTDLSWPANPLPAWNETQNRPRYVQAQGNDVYEMAFDLSYLPIDLNNFSLDLVALDGSGQAEAFGRVTMANGTFSATDLPAGNYNRSDYLPQIVPDGGCSLLMLAGGFAALGFMRRRQA